MVTSNAPPVSMMLIALEIDTAQASSVIRGAEETGADTGDEPNHKHFICTPNS